MKEERVYQPEAERIAGELRADILDGIRPPGSRLVERDIAAESGSSRIPVRDALKTLVGEGLVTLRPRSWAVVREITTSDLDDLNEVRSALEVLAFRLAAARRTGEDLARLRRCLDESTEAIRNGESQKARRFGADFHAMVIEIAGNTLLNEISHMLDSRMRWLLSQYDNLTEVAEEHEDLFRAIEAGDTELAATLAGEHVCKAHPTLPKPLQRRP